MPSKITLKLKNTTYFKKNIVLNLYSYHRGKLRYFFVIAQYVEVMQPF